jgi:hypothetical protein
MRTNYVQRNRPDSVGNTLHYFGPTSATRNVLIFITIAASVVFFTSRGNMDLLAQVAVTTQLA